MFQGQSPVSEGAPTGDIKSRITESLKELHRRIDGDVPEYGEFTPIESTFNVSDVYPEIGEVKLVLAHFENESLSFDKQDQRSLKYLAATPSGKSTTSQYVHLGNKKDLKNLMAKKQTLDTVLEYLASTQRDFIELNAG
jgi:hypothetical protein